MKKKLFSVFFIISIFSVMSIAYAENSYWDEVKSIYDWNAMETSLEMDLEVTSDIKSELNSNYRIKLNGKSNLKDFSSYMELEVEDLKDSKEIPTIKIYSHKNDTYVNREAVEYLLLSMELEDIPTIDHDFVMLKGDDQDIMFDEGILNDLLDFIENIDLGMDLGMVKEGNTFTLNLDSDQIIDVTDSYMRYVIENMNELLEIFIPSEVDGLDQYLNMHNPKEVLDMYNTQIAPYLEIARATVEGSSYSQSTTFGEDQFQETANLILNTPMANVNLSMVSETNKLSSYDLNLPSSVLVVTEEDLTDLIMGIDGRVRPKIVLSLEGDYVVYLGDIEHNGQIQLRVDSGKAYISSDDTLELFGISIEGEEIWIRDLEQYGINVEWMEESRSIYIQM